VVVPGTTVAGVRWDVFTWPAPSVVPLEQFAPIRECAAGSGQRDHESKARFHLDASFPVYRATLRNWSNAGLM
jgi:hypothetical protein